MRAEAGKVLVDQPGLPFIREHIVKRAKLW